MLNRVDDTNHARLRNLFGRQTNPAASPAFALISIPPSLSRRSSSVVHVPSSLGRVERASRPLLSIPSLYTLSLTKFTRRYGYFRGRNFHITHTNRICRSQEANQAAAENKTRWSSHIHILKVTAGKNPTEQPSVKQQSSFPLFTF